MILLISLNCFISFFLLYKLWSPNIKEISLVQMEEDVKRLQQYFKNLKSKDSFEKFIEKCFELALDCHDKGNPNSIFKIWNEETDLPKGIRKALKSKGSIKDELRNQFVIYQKIIKSFQNSSDTEEMSDEEIERGKKRLKSLISGPKVELPSFLSSIIVYIDPEVEPETQNKVIRYTIAYGGKVETNFKKATHIIMNSDQNIELYGSILKVEPQFILLCHSRQRKVSEDAFIIS